MSKSLDIVKPELNTFNIVYYILVIVLGALLLGLGVSMVSDFSDSPFDSISIMPLAVSYFLWFIGLMIVLITLYSLVDEIRKYRIDFEDYLNELAKEEIRMASVQHLFYNGWTTQNGTDHEQYTMNEMSW